MPGQKGHQRVVRSDEQEGTDHRELADFSSAARRVIDLIASCEFSGWIAKDLIEIPWAEGGEPAEIVAARGLKQVSGLGSIKTDVDEIISANPAQVEREKANPKLAGWFVGAVLKATGGKANPAVVNELVATKLGL